jgi:hypothetical protein
MIVTWEFTATIIGGGQPSSAMELEFGGNKKCTG